MRNSTTTCITSKISGNQELTTCYGTMDYHAEIIATGLLIFIAIAVYYYILKSFFK